MTRYTFVVESESSNDRGASQSFRLRRDAEELYALLSSSQHITKLRLYRYENDGRGGRKDGSTVVITQIGVL